jgi:hypothetical protein
MPEDNPKFQGLLENEDEEAVYPDISAELPGVTLEDKEDSTDRGGGTRLSRSGCTGTRECWSRYRRTHTGHK